MICFPNFLFCGIFLRLASFSLETIASAFPGIVGCYLLMVSFCLRILRFVFLGVCDLALAFVCCFCLHGFHKSMCLVVG